MSINLKDVAAGPFPGVADAAIDANAAVKIVSPGRFAMVAITDSSALCVGFAVTAAGSGGDPITVRPLTGGYPFIGLSDGGALIDEGASVTVSNVTAGRVMPATIGVIAINYGAQVAATPDEKVSLFGCIGGGGTFEMDLRPHVVLNGGTNTGAHLTGLFAVGGGTPSEGDLVLVTTNGTYAYETGFWYASAGLWTRPNWYANGQHAEGACGFAISGSRAFQIWKAETLGPNDIIGTHSIVWSPLVVSGELVGGATLWRDASTNTGMSQTGPLIIVFHANVDTFLLRGESDNATALFAPMRSLSINGYPLVTGDYYHVWSQTHSKLYGTVQRDHTVSEAPSPTFNVNTGAFHTYPLDQTLTSWILTAPVDQYGEPQGCTITVSFDQDGTGGWTLGTAPTNAKFVTTFTPAATANTRSTIRFIWDVTLHKWIEDGRTLGIVL